MKTPDITLAQIMAAIKWIVAQLVITTLVDNNTAQYILQICATVVPAAWMVADAIIRHGRAKVAAAQAAKEFVPR